MSKRREELIKDYLCPDCGGRTIIRDDYSGEIICGSCGLVIRDSIINRGAEWRAFTQKEKDSRSRVGSPPSFYLHDKGLSTTFSHVNRDAHGKKIPQKTKPQMLRLKKWQARVSAHSSIERNLLHAMNELNRLAEKLHIAPAVREEAAVIYRKALNNGLIRGRSISAITAASLYAACRITKTQRTLKEVARHTPFDKKEVSYCYRLLLSKLQLRMPVPNPQLRVPKIASKAGIGERTQHIAVEILREAERLKKTAGKDPMGLAAAALYIACVINNEKCTQKKIGEAAGVTEVTIRNRYKNLKEDLKLDI